MLAFISITGRLASSKPSRPTTDVELKRDILIPFKDFKLKPMTSSELLASHELKKRSSMDVPPHVVSNIHAQALKINE